jgi:hypothetical protein
LRTSALNYVKFSHDLHESERTVLAPPPPPFTENLEASPALEVCGVMKMPNDEWIRTLADGRKVKFSHDEAMDATFITAQIEGNEVVYSILLNKAEIKLSREEVEGRFERELSKK